MPQDIIYGKFYIKDKEYPFFLSGQIITVTQIPREHNKDFGGTYHFEYLKGVTSSGKYIFLLDCDVFGGQLIEITSNLQLSCKGYILSNSPSEFFDRIEFYSPALNGFYSPRQAISLEKDEVRFGVRSLRFKNYEDTAQKFCCTINGETIDCELSFRSSVTLRPEDASIGSVNTTLTMKFPAQRSINELSKYYLYLLDFLVFINFRSDVPIGDIILYKEAEERKFAKSGTAKIFQQDCSQYSADNLHSITYRDLPDGSIANLFVAIAERREKGTYNPFFMPTDRKDAAYFDSAKWLIAAISFEGEFNQNYPDFKYQNDERFKQAKDLLLKCIDDAVIASGVGINNKANKPLKSFRHLVSTTDTTIKEKFDFCLSKYSSEIDPIVEKHSRTNDVPKGVDFAQAYSDYRNSTAHGTILPITKVEIVTYQLLRCFIYILILEHGGVPLEKIKDIISRLF